MNLQAHTQKFNVNVKANRINKYDEQWYSILTPSGEKDFKSVTTVLDAFPKGIGYKLWLQKVGDEADNIRNEAGQLGTHIHKIIELTLRGETVSFENADGTRNCTLIEWERYLSWCLWYQDARDNAGLKPLFIEQIVYDESLEVAGTIDLIAETALGIFIFDWKTGSYLGDIAEIQISTYFNMANKMKLFGEIRGANIIHLYPSLNKAGFRVHDVKNVDEGYALFLNTIPIWKRLNKNAKPKYKIYPNAVSLELLSEERLEL